MARDSRGMWGDGPFVFAQVTNGVGVDTITDAVVAGLQATRTPCGSARCLGVPRRATGADEGASVCNPNRVAVLYIGMLNRDPARTEVLRGTLDLMVLQTLVSLGPSHGYAIAARLEQVSDGALLLNMGTLYPGLMRLEQRGLVRGEWGTTEKNRRARFYAITAAGRRDLATEKRGLDRMVSIIEALFQEPA